MSAFIALPQCEGVDRPWVVEVPAPRAATSHPAAQVTLRKHVLVVDDDTLVRASLSAVLECEGYRVTGAADGYEALRRARQERPDLILLDLNMPFLDGWATFNKLDEQALRPPVIVITARPHQYTQAVRLGVDALMEKPLDIPSLLAATHRLTRDSESPPRSRSDSRTPTSWLGHGTTGREPSDNE